MKLALDVDLAGFFSMTTATMRPDGISLSHGAPNSVINSARIKAEFWLHLKVIPHMTWRRIARELD